jgi:putative ABC transport system substrate-binding protein
MGVTALGGAAVAWPLAAQSQPAAKATRIGFLSPVTFAPGSTGGNLAESVIKHLGQFGYKTGVNLEVEKRAAEGHLERLPSLARELVDKKVALIIVHSYPAAAAARQATLSIPVVILNAGDPVKTGLVLSLARPGGNVTGVSDVAAELAPKRLELLKEMTPSLQRVAMLWNAGDLGMTTRYDASAAAARQLGVVVQSLGVREPDDFEAAFAAMNKEMPDGLLMVADSLTFLNRKRVYDFASKNRLPTVFEAENFIRDGGLMSYGPELSESQEVVARLVLRILRGSRPDDLPMEQPTHFRLVMNLKTAKALDLTIPPTLLARADEVIE